MKRLLLTGFAGSIGCHTLAHVMHNTDWHVVGMDSFRHHGWTDKVNQMLQAHPDWVDRLTVITHDLTAPISPVMVKKIGHIDYIINMASLSDVEQSIEDPVPFVENNVALILNILEYSREVKPEVFIQISTDEVYGPVEKGGKHKEWSAIVPSNPYAASKCAQEAIAISYWRTYDVPLIITNFMNNFGEMQAKAKFPAVLQKRLANNEEIVVYGVKNDDGTLELGSRSYIHSRNSADALLYIIHNLPPHLHVRDTVDKPDRYNICGDKQLNNLELAEIFAKFMHKENFKYRLDNVHSLRPGHDWHYGLDDSKLKGLGWKSPLTFEESLKNVIEWQSEHPDWL